MKRLAARYAQPASLLILSCAILFDLPLAVGLAGSAPFPVRYVHEPEPGVANARNAAMAAKQCGVIG